MDVKYHTILPQMVVVSSHFTLLTEFAFVHIEVQNKLVLHDMHALIRESVDSLCRDGSDTPIVRVHWKIFLTREHSRFKPFSAREWPIQPILYPTIPHK